MTKLTLTLLFLTGCATFEPAPYWKRVSEPVPIQRIEYADKVICLGKEVWGCADYVMRVIRVSKAAPPSLWACIEQHERTHFAGYTHPAGESHLGGIWCGLNTFQRRPV